MASGLFGKLPAKRDFIAFQAPQSFLQVWEAWLQAGLSASRLTLNERWTDAFLRAPIWRFWLGSGICGTPTLGAIMPSVDGVGRYFPLTLFARPSEGRDFAPPRIDARAAWFEAVETVLLATLDGEQPYEQTCAAVSALPQPIEREPPEAPPGVELIGTSWIARDAAAPQLAAPSLGREFAREKGASIWWTAGGEGFAPRVVECDGLPDPYLFAGFLDGNFDAAVAAPAFAQGPLA